MYRLFVILPVRFLRTCNTCHLLYKRIVKRLTHQLSVFTLTLGTDSPIAAQLTDGTLSFSALMITTFHPA